MKLEWMGEFRDIIGNFYRSANGYSQICKEELFGEPVRFSPYEVQIMEHILEHADQHRNMKWYASRLGLSQATYSKYVRKLVDKGLLEKYHVVGNKKDIILQVSPLGIKEYEAYSKLAEKYLFRDFLSHLQNVSPDELEAIRKTFALLGNMHGEKILDDDDKLPELVKVKPKTPVPAGITD